MSIDVYLLRRNLLNLVLKDIPQNPSNDYINGVMQVLINLHVVTGVDFARKFALMQKTSLIGR